MAFIPNSTITLCHVEFDNSYKNQVYFASATEQKNYFLGRAKKTFTDYLVVRKTLPNGALQSGVKVDANIDSLYGCNYMYYCNENHGQRVFYAFIVDLIYINEGTTEIVFETDVYQTWRFDVDVLDSFVVREHGETDNVGDNLIAEPSLQPKEFVYEEIKDYIYSNGDGTGTTYDRILGFDTWGYLVVTTDPRTVGGINTGSDCLMSGIFQGLYFYMFYDLSALSEMLSDMETAYGDETIMCITLIPSFCVQENGVAEGGILTASDEPVSRQFTIDTGMYTEFGFTVKNNKLFTSQFFKLAVTPHDGTEMEYGFELFDDLWHPSFKIAGDVSINPTATVFPLDYKGVSENIDNSVQLVNFPQSAWNSDAFKLWLTKNQYTMTSGTALDIAKIIGGIGTTVASGGMASFVGGSIAISGATSIVERISNVMNASKMGSNGHGGNPKSNLLTALKKNKIDFYIKKVRDEYAKMVDDYFTMFGYQTNAVKVPNVSVRPCFNYVETIDVNIADKTFGIPNKDMETLKKMYNSGVTLWKPSATIGDYSVDNSPS